MDTETIKCFNEVKESFLDTQTEEELALLNPRDIRVTIESWATPDTDKGRVEEMIFEWVKQFRGFGTDQGLTIDEKHKFLDATLQLADRDIDSIVEKAGTYTNRVAAYEKDMKLFIDKIRDMSGNNKTRLVNTLAKVNYNYIWEYGSDPVPSKEEEIKIIAEEIRKRTGHKKTVPVMRLAREEYSNIFGEGRFLDSYYPYLHSFLLEILDYEYFVSMEIEPNIKRLKYLRRSSSANILKETLVSKEWHDRWLYFSQAGIKNRHRYATTINSDKWAIPFEDFAHLYRALHRKSNEFITSPLPSK